MPENGCGSAQTAIRGTSYIFFFWRIFRYRTSSSFYHLTTRRLELCCPAYLTLPKRRMSSMLPSRFHPKPTTNDDDKRYRLNRQSLTVTIRPCFWKSYSPRQTTSLLQPFATTSTGSIKHETAHAIHRLQRAPDLQELHRASRQQIGPSWVTHCHSDSQAI